MRERGTARVRIAPELRFLLPRRHRGGDVSVILDGTSSVLHVVESLGVPRTEIGTLLVGGAPVSDAYRPQRADEVRVLPVMRPQALAEPRFLLDVHLGALARRMRLVGLDSAYGNQADDDELVAAAGQQRRMLLTRDRGLLKRRALTGGAYVRGDSADDQLADVIERFAPDLAPWTRCLMCNGILEEVPLDRVAHLLQPGTVRSYATFARCRDCGRPYWRGAHADRLNAVVQRAVDGNRADRNGSGCRVSPTGTGWRSGGTGSPSTGWRYDMTTTPDGPLNDDDMETVGHSVTGPDADTVDADADGTDSTDSDGTDGTDSDGTDGTDSDGTDGTDSDATDGTDSDATDS